MAASKAATLACRRPKLKHALAPVLALMLGRVLVWLRVRVLRVPAMV